MSRSRYVPLAFLLAISGVPAACDQAPVSEPLDQADYTQVAPNGLLSLCQVAPSTSSRATIGVLGGSIRAGGVTMTVPVGAVLQATEFRMQVPSSQYAEVEIHANGQEHFQFLAPVVISMDYSRCSMPSGVLLSAWHIDPDTKSLLENMGGVNDVLNQRVIFSTMHLSGYAIAN
ncbi:MAG TPA: hypothetical protein VHG09_06355 [Longimicrobiales bacterium]|nr:hypothetical protein [Longimicrobiales bacterium]